MSQMPTVWPISKFIFLFPSPLGFANPMRINDGGETEGSSQERGRVRQCRISVMWIELGGKKKGLKKNCENHKRFVISPFPGPNVYTIASWPLMPSPSSIESPDKIKKKMSEVDLDTNKWLFLDYFLSKNKTRRLALRQQCQSTHA